MTCLQGNLLTAGAIGIVHDAPAERVRLDERSWVDVVRGFVTGADDVCLELAESVDWRQGRRRIFDRYLDEPRLSRWYRRGDALPHPVLADTCAAIERRYGVPLRGAGLNYYRTGRDSVAFHRDTELRRLDDTIVAIATFGARRPFLVRPDGGGRSIDLAPASGDLLVLGGRCQADWEHGVPKVRDAGPRISASWRWVGRGRPA